MKGRHLAIVLGTALAATIPLQATNAVDLDADLASRTALPYLQCVPYARQVSGIRIYGDAHTWWGQAEGRYAKGDRPRIGAVMSFRPHNNMRLGHVAAVSKIINSRTVLLKHANWSPINGRRGQIEDDVRAIDVSPDNDWSKVRVWYAPIKALGGTEWPLNGFIYNEKPGRDMPGRKAAGTALAKAASVKSGVDASPAGKDGSSKLVDSRAKPLAPGSTPARTLRSVILSGDKSAAGQTDTGKRQRASAPAAKPVRLRPALPNDPIGGIIFGRNR